jgi:(R,R)-butanediol dehydrogenase/meso-butanediol dehydrogenase/diacetyl reductase
MRAAVFKGAGLPLSIETVTDPQVHPERIVLAVERSGICGSDLHMAQSAHTAPGLILGHEFAGSIAAVGSKVPPGWNVGDRVTALPLNACNTCEICERGLYALCSQNLFTGTSLLAQGAYAQFVSVRPGMLQQLPANVGFDEGAMVEPLAVAHHIVSMSELPAGGSVLILGGGPIGIAVALFALRAGARHVVVRERCAQRRALALAIGASAAIDPEAMDVAQAFATKTSGARPQVVFECVGLPGMLSQAIDLVAVRGQVIVAGVVLQQDTFLPLAALGKEVTIRYSQAYTEADFDAVIGALARREIEAKPIHTSTVGLDELPGAFAALAKQSGQCKILIRP